MNAGCFMGVTLGRLVMFFLTIKIAKAIKRNTASTSGSLWKLPWGNLGQIDGTWLNDIGNGIRVSSGGFRKRWTPTDSFSCPTLPFLVHLRFAAQLSLESFALLVSVERRRGAFASGTLLEPLGVHFEYLRFCRISQVFFLCLKYKFLTSVIYWTKTTT